MNKNGAANVIQVITSYPARMAVYGGIVLLVFQGIYLLLQRFEAAWLVAENGPLELAQVACLVLAAPVIALAAKWTPVGRAVLVAAAAATIYAAARESDQWFESIFFEDAYKVLVGLPAALLVMIAAYRDRERIIVETMHIARYPGATMFTIAGIYLCFFCQMFDRPLFWIDSGSDAGVGVQKPLVEECSELFAYLLIAFSSVEAAISAFEDRAKLSRAKQVTNSDAPRSSSDSGDGLRTAA